MGGESLKQNCYSAVAISTDCNICYCLLQIFALVTKFAMVLGPLQEFVLHLNQLVSVATQQPQGLPLHLEVGCEIFG